MNYQLAQHRHHSSKRAPTRVNSLRSRSDDILIAAATLGLVATIVDGDADIREIETFTREFREHFALSQRHSLRLISAALSRIRGGTDSSTIDCACDTLNEHLTTSQRLTLFDWLGEVLVSDGKILEGEEYFLDYIVQRLNLSEPIREKYRVA